MTLYNIKVYNDKGRGTFLDLKINVKTLKIYNILPKLVSIVNKKEEGNTANLFGRMALVVRLRDGGLVAKSEYHD